MVSDPSLSWRCTSSSFKRRRSAARSAWVIMHTRLARRRARAGICNESERCRARSPTGFGEAHQPPAVLVPQLEAHGAQPVPHGQGGHLMEDRVLVVCPLQVVVGDAGAEVVDVVQADVAGEELEHLGQLQIGAAAQRGVGVAPAVGALPVGVLELVLDVEQPDAGGAREQHCGRLHEQVVAPAHQPAQRSHEHGQGDVGADHAAAQARSRRSVIGTNVALAVLVGALCWLMGWRDYLLVQAPTVLLAGSAGIWLFYVQHQFEDAYWESADGWSYADAALRGSSYLKLPKVLQFFSGNIGLHHVHHLSARIPNYNLQRAQDENPIFHDVPTLSLTDGMRAVRLKLYDEERRRMVTFSQARKNASTAPRPPLADAGGRARTSQRPRT